MKKYWSRLVLGMVVVGLCAGLIGWLRANWTDPRPVIPNLLQPGELPGGEPESSEPPEKTDLSILFDDGATEDSEKTMSFGLIITAVKDADTPTGYKQLTWHPQGITSNACLKIDGKEQLFGHPPGEWVQREGDLGKNAQGEKRRGLKSIWRMKDKIQVTQIAEILRGTLTGRLDTCRVQYRIENQDTKPHQIGLRFLLDTLAGTSDGAPFVVPGRDWLCEKQMQFKTAADVPPFVFALEEMNLHKPGVVAQIGLKMPQPFEPPVRLTLGGWPNDKKIKGAKGGLTLWEVPVFPLDKFNDSAATIYWTEKELAPNGKRALGFTYGLGLFSGNKAGNLGMFLAGGPYLGGELVVTALLKDAEAGQKLTLISTAPFDLVACPAEQTIAIPPAGKEPFSPVSWTIRLKQAGKLLLRLEATAGLWQEQTIMIQEKK